MGNRVKNVKKSAKITIKIDNNFSINKKHFQFTIKNNGFTENLIKQHCYMRTLMMMALQNILQKFYGKTSQNVNIFTSYFHILTFFRYFIGIGLTI